MDHDRFTSERGASGRPTGPRDRTLRAATADREAIAKTLGRHHVEGRLSGEEFQERIDRCYAATTLADLDALVTDLPRDQERGAEPDRPRAPGNHRGPRRFMWIAPLIIGFIALSILTGGHALWFFWPLAIVTFVRFGPLRWRRCSERDRSRGEEGVSV